MTVPAMVIFNYKIIALSSSPFILAELTTVSAPDFIVIPGAGNPDNDRNVFFKSRIESAIEAHRHFPKSKLVCIGRKDNRRYNEPEEMKMALLNQGIPESLIIADTGGFNTFSMLVQLSENYNGRLLFISQRIHLQRILFASGRMGIKAEGYVVPQPESRRKQKFFRNREIISALRMTVNLAGYKIAKVF